MATIIGTTGTDTLLGTADDDVIKGRWHGDDTFNGFGGNDQLYGTDGSNNFRGGTGSDQMWAGMSGGVNSDGEVDTFVFETTNDTTYQYDQVYGFGAEDKISFDTDGSDGANLPFGAHITDVVQNGNNWQITWQNETDQSTTNLNTISINTVDGVVLDETFFTNAIFDGDFF